MRRRTWRVPLRGGTKRSTRSVKATRPTLSLLLMALKASTAASSAATSRFCCTRVPNWWLPLQSTTSITVSSRSSMNRLMNGWPMRAVTFQSMVRMSSPGWYSRTSSKAMPVPLKTEWYSPPSRSSTARRARSCRRRIWRTTSAGSIYDPLRKRKGGTCRGSPRSMIQENRIDRAPPLVEPMPAFVVAPARDEAPALGTDVPYFVKIFPHAEVQASEERCPQRRGLALGGGRDRNANDVGLPLQEPDVAGHAAIDAQLRQGHAGVVAGGINQVGDLKRDALQRGSGQIGRAGVAR